MLLLLPEDSQRRFLLALISKSLGSVRESSRGISRRLFLLMSREETISNAARSFAVHTDDDDDDDDGADEDALPPRKDKSKEVMSLSLKST